jgi:hypothetical protein
MTLRQDPSIPGDLHDMRVEIAVQMEEGAELHAECKGPKGNWGMPPLEPEEHLVKLRDCLGRALLRRDMEEVLERLEDLDRQSAEGVRRILRLLSKRQSRRKR